MYWGQSFLTTKLENRRPTDTFIKLLAKRISHIAPSNKIKLLHIYTSCSFLYKCRSIVDWPARTIIKFLSHPSCSIEAGSAHQFAKSQQLPPLQIHQTYNNSVKRQPLSVCTWVYGGIPLGEIRQRKRTCDVHPLPAPIHLSRKPRDSLCNTARIRACVYTVAFVQLASPREREKTKPCYSSYLFDRINRCRAEEWMAEERKKYREMYDSCGRASRNHISSAL